MVWYPDFDVVDDLHQVTMIETDEPLWPLMSGGREKIESALFAPQHSAHYEDADLFAQAALLIGRIAVAHGYENGNKRTSLAVGERFLEENGSLLRADVVIQHLIVAVVASNSNQIDPNEIYEQLATALKDGCTSAPGNP